MRIWLAVLVGLMSTPAPAQLHPTARAVITQAVEGAIRPAFGSFAQETELLQKVVGGLCDEPSEAGLKTARSQFSEVVVRWSRIELYRFGPLMQDNRSDRILFWPDRKGIALRQVQAILATKDATATDVTTLQAKSVAVQGLGALEFVLFGTDAETLATPAGDFRCDYGNAIATLIGVVAKDMRDEWFADPGIGSRMIRPSEADPDYRNNDEVLTELVGVLAHGVEAIRDQRILPFLGRDAEASKPKSALFWRSEMTVPAILANFDSLRILLRASDIAAYTPTEQFWIGEQADDAFDAVLTAASKVKRDPIDDVLADPAQKAAIGDMVVVSQTLGKLTGEDLPAALGLSVGFSSLDGD